MKKRHWAAVAVPLFLLAIAIIYIALGGTNEVKKSVLEKPSYTLYGQYYDGKVGADTLQMLFMDAVELVEANESLDEVVMVYFGQANEDTGEVHNFVGVEADDKIKMPSDWEALSLSAKQSVMGCIEANPIVMPTPASMHEELTAYAVEQQITLDTLFMERYKGPNNVCVEILGL